MSVVYAPVYVVYQYTGIYPLSRHEQIEILVWVGLGARVVLRLDSLSGIGLLSGHRNGCAPGERSAGKRVAIPSLGKSADEQFFRYDDGQSHWHAAGSEAAVLTRCDDCCSNKR
jgi:hypothetical protein